jgi:hypothetical protein
MNDTIIFFVLAALALIFKWLTSKGSDDSAKPQPNPPNEPIQRAPPKTEEERVRRFLEALGVPPGTQPPSPVRTRTVTPRPAATPAPHTPPQKIRRSWAQPLPPVVTTPEDMPLPPLATTPQPEPVFVVQTQPASATVVPPPLPAGVSTRPFAAPVARKASPTRTPPMTSLRAALRSRERIRQAIILREVLGPPRGLEPFGQIQGL